MGNSKQKIETCEGSESPHQYHNSMMKILKLKEGDAIVFGFKISETAKEELLVSRITYKGMNYVTTVFDYGQRQVDVTVFFSDILAIFRGGEGNGRLFGKTFDILQPENELIKEHQNHNRKLYGN